MFNATTWITLNESECLAKIQKQKRTKHPQDQKKRLSMKMPCTILKMICAFEITTKTLQYSLKK